MGAGDNYQATIFAKEEKKVETTDEKSKLERDQEKIQKLGDITKLLDSYGTKTTP